VFVEFRAQQNEEFVANAVQVEMQHHHLYITCHVARATNVVVVY
jgi:hypothetical protein